MHDFIGLFLLGVKVAALGVILIIISIIIGFVANAGSWWTDR